MALSHFCGACQCSAGRTLATAMSNASRSVVVTFPGSVEDGDVAALPLPEHEDAPLELDAYRSGPSSSPSTPGRSARRASCSFACRTAPAVIASPAECRWRAGGGTGDARRRASRPRRARGTGGGFSPRRPGPPRRRRRAPAGGTASARRAPARSHTPTRRSRPRPDLRPRRSPARPRIGTRLFHDQFRRLSGRILVVELELHLQRVPAVVPARAARTPARSVGESGRARVPSSYVCSRRQHRRPVGHQVRVREEDDRLARIAELVDELRRS